MEKEGRRNSDKGGEGERRESKEEKVGGVEVKVEGTQNTPTNKSERGEPSSLQSTSYPIHHYAYMMNGSGR